MRLAPAAGTVNPIIDIDEGLERVMGDRALYARMLRRFHSDYAGGAKPIRAALACGERARAHRLAHTLKGAAGMIGAHALHAQASIVEQALDSGTDSGTGDHGESNNGEDEQLDRLELALAQVLQTIDKLLADAGVPGAPPAPLSGPASTSTDAALLAQMIYLLMRGDGAALDLLEESGARLAAIVGEARFEQVAAAMREFDFERALAALAPPGSADGDAGTTGGA